jgi:hypothetical protein
MLPSSLTLPDKFRDLAIVDLDICLSLRIGIGQQSGSYNSDTRDSVEKPIDQNTETLACVLNVQIPFCIVRTDMGFRFSSELVSGSNQSYCTTPRIVT